MMFFPFGMSGVERLEQNQAVADDDADHHRSDDEPKCSERLILREAAERQVRDLLGLTLRDFVQPTDRREQRNEKNQTDRNGGDEQSNPSVFSQRTGSQWNQSCPNSNREEPTR